MVKSGIFGQTAKFGQRPRKEPSHLDLHCLQVCVRTYLMSEFTRLYPNAHACVVCE